MGLSRWLKGKESICQWRKCRFDSWIGKIPWRRKWQPTPVFLPRKPHGQRSLAGKESDMTEWLILSCFIIIHHGPELYPKLIEAYRQHLEDLCGLKQRRASHTDSTGHTDFSSAIRSSLPSPEKMTKSLQWAQVGTFVWWCMQHGYDLSMKYLGKTREANRMRVNDSETSVSQ